jgi:hypothetical protein
LIRKVGRYALNMAGKYKKDHPNRLNQNSPAGQSQITLGTIIGEKWKIDI